jgi:hypothetical protein
VERERDRLRPLQQNALFHAGAREFGQPRTQPGASRADKVDVGPLFGNNLASDLFVVAQVGRRWYRSLLSTCNGDV